MRSNNTPKPSPRETFSRAEKQLKVSLLWVLFFSFFINIFVLALPFYSLQVFDRVLTSQSLDTLWLLSIITIAFIILHAVLDWIRQRMLLSASEQWSSHIGASLHGASIFASSDSNTNNAQIINLMKGVRNTLSSSLSPLFDTPWTPLILLFLVGLHPLYGVICVFVIALLIGLAMLNFHYRSKANLQQLSLTQTSIEDTNSVRAMGMTKNIAAITSAQDSTVYKKMVIGLGQSTNIASASKFLRALAQVSLVAIGAILVIEREITAGAMIAATMLSARVFSPYEALVSNLYPWINANRYWKELVSITLSYPKEPQEASLPAAQGKLTAENVMLLYPDSNKPFLSRINIDIPSGSCIAIVGDSGSGKSTLLKALAGLIKPSLGQVRLDGATYLQWYSEELADVLGYYSTDSQFLPGSIIENLSLFQSEYDVENVYNACKALGLHEQILKWPKGYETDITKDIRPSSSEYHKLLLARTLFSTPKLLIWDQPNAFLGPTDERLLHQILVVRKRMGLTTIFTTNQSSLLGFSDRIIFLENGTIKSDTETKKIAAAQKIPMKKVSNNG
ncbi:ATP-binding cassette domain-containing protein [Vibrio genomosp. F10]|uniref:ATP-binding cassette domain-containing protein n=1 Tax=Vibrio genomosp. F10 TaxID=723171 RepID=UPI0003667CBB|nr:ATP-binding cassette domain-containing protein [Vibrio genomosp. F10]OEF06288.1 hypothetical protein A1QI_06545 [Vibrio genomosp. F10 str. 9ZB36]